MAGGSSQRVVPLHTNIGQLVEIKSKSGSEFSAERPCAEHLFKTSSNCVKAIEDFVAAYGPEAKPFIWRKREVKGTQLRNTIVNLRN